MKKVSINVLIHERAEFLPMTVWSLKQIKNKEDIKVKLLVTQDNRTRNSQKSLEMAKVAGNQLMEAGIEVHARAFTRLPPYNFMDKLRWIVNQEEPYIIRVDDDCFAAPATWDKLIESTTALDDNPNLLAAAPSVTNGIPTFEYWVQTFCSMEQGYQLYKMCLDNPCLTKWQKVFTSLKPAYEQEYWLPDLYYRLCYEMNDERLGIHPMRFNLKIQKTINKMIIDGWDRFINPPCQKSISVFPQTRPYFCNTCFIIKKKHYHAIVQDRTLARDSFEELTFNNYRRLHGMELMFHLDAWMLNFYYRAVGNIKIERELYQEIQQRLP
jgi:hypothetical protein